MKYLIMLDIRPIQAVPGFLQQRRSVFGRTKTSGALLVQFSTGRHPIDRHVQQLLRFDDVHNPIDVVEHRQQHIFVGLGCYFGVVGMGTVV